MPISLLVMLNLVLNIAATTQNTGPLTNFIFLNIDQESNPQHNPLNKSKIRKKK